jgi:hypothetical protein
MSFTSPSKNPHELNQEKKGDRKHPPPPTMIRTLPVQKGTNMMGEVRTCIISVEGYSNRDMMQSSVTSHRRFFKIERTNFVFNQSVPYIDFQ